MTPTLSVKKKTPVKFLDDFLHEAFQSPSRVVLQIRSFLKDDISDYRPYASLATTFYESVIQLLEKIESESPPKPILEIHTTVTPQDAGLVELRPNLQDYQNFPRLLRQALTLGAGNSGVFKIKLPAELRQAVTVQGHDEITVSRFRATQKAPDIFELNRTQEASAIEVADCHYELSDEELSARFRSLLTTSLVDIAYITDYDARDDEQRRPFGLPDKSPIWPMSGNELDNTVGTVPGLHYPFGYKSGKAFGAPFALHEEDGGLLSLNVLYHGHKIWNVVAPAHKQLVKDHYKATINHRHNCAQSLRHASVYIAPQLLEKWGAQVTTLRQNPYEIVVILRDALHEGFSIGSTVAEAVNYAPQGWSIAGYQECTKACSRHPIPNALLMRRMNSPRRTRERPSVPNDVTPSLPRKRKRAPDKPRLPKPESLIDFMAAAVAVPDAVILLKQILRSVDTSFKDLLRSTEGVDLMHAVEKAERLSAENCYVRRFALLRMAEIYDRCPTKNHKSRMQEEMIEKAWGIGFPSSHTGQRFTKSGLIDASTAQAKLWNKHKTRLMSRLSAGRRWLTISRSFGLPTVALISPDWNSGGTVWNINDTTFEQKLSTADHHRLLKTIENRGNIICPPLRQDTRIVDALVDPALANKWLKEHENALQAIHNT